MTDIAKALRQGCALASPFRFRSIAKTKDGVRRSSSPAGVGWGIRTTRYTRRGRVEAISENIWVKRSLSQNFEARLE